MSCAECLIPRYLALPTRATPRHGRATARRVRWGYGGPGVTTPARGGRPGDGREGSDVTTVPHTTRRVHAGRGRTDTTPTWPSAAAEAARLRAADPAGRYAALAAELDRLARWDADTARRRWRREGYRA
jgi:hypothetical protein